MPAISTHVLDTAAGDPAQGIQVTLEMESPGGGSWQTLGSGFTDSDGRIGDLLGGPLVEGIYRLRFDTGSYFEAREVEGFYPEAAVVFRVADPGRHYHVPLLLSPFGYATYRGS